MATSKATILANLDLELSERIQKLRTQYKVMSASLSTRGEMRIQRLTRATRNTKLADFIARYELRAAEAMGAQKANSIPTAVPVNADLTAPAASIHNSRYQANASSLPATLSKPSRGATSTNTKTNINTSTSTSAAAAAAAAMQSPNTRHRSPLKKVVPTSSQLNHAIGGAGGGATAKRKAVGSPIKSPSKLPALVGQHASRSNASSAVVATAAEPVRRVGNKRVKRTD